MCSVKQMIFNYPNVNTLIKLYRTYRPTYYLEMAIPEARPKDKSNIIGMVSLYKAGSEIFKYTGPMLKLIHVHGYPSICEVMKWDKYKICPHYCTI